MEGSSPARLYALLVGGTVLVAGIIGFFYNASFATGDSIDRDAVFGILEVNGWHNVVHIALGGLGLAMASGAAREYALGVGVLYLVIAFLGFIDFGSGDTTDNILKIVPVNTEDNFLHVILGVTGIGAALSTPKAGDGGRRPAATTA